MCDIQNERDPKAVMEEPLVGSIDIAQIMHERIYIIEDKRQFDESDELTGGRRNSRAFRNQIVSDRVSRLDTRRRRRRAQIPLVCLPTDNLLISPKTCVT